MESTLAEEVNPHVAFINPSAPGNAYWDNYTSYMQVAAASLGIELTVAYAKDNRLQGAHLATDLLQQEHPPQFLIYIYQRGASHRILKLAETHGVNSLIVNTNISDAERKLVGKPREKYQRWLGHIHPRNVEVGKQLALELYASAKRQRTGISRAPIQLLALSGSRDSSAGLDYNEGLKLAINEHEDLILKQLVFSDWSFSKASYQVRGLMERYPEVDVIWSIGEEIALGVLDGLGKTNPGGYHHVLVGGTVSSKKGLQQVKQGNLIANMGGDSWEGALALVTLYDFLHGHDIPVEDYTIRYTTQLVSQETVEPFTQLIEQEKWKQVDYRKLTATHTGKRIPFTVQTLLAAVSDKTESQRIKASKSVDVQQAVKQSEKSIEKKELHP